MSEAPQSSKSQRIRDELWSTFFHEMDDLLEKLESQLLDIEKNLDSEDLIAGLFRTMHTLKGTAGMMGLNNVETLAHKAEDIMDLVRAHEMDLNPQIIDLMFSTLDSLKAAQTIITDTRQDINGEQNTDLIAALKAYAAGNKNSPAQPVDASIWQQILQECREQLDHIEASALSLEKGNAESFDPLFRALHSLKSAVDFARLVNATQLVHRCEDLVGLLRDQAHHLPKGVIDAVLAVTDLLRQAFDKADIDSTQDLTPSSIAPLFQQIDALLVAITGNVFSEYTSEKLTEVTINSDGVMLSKKHPQSLPIDDSYWQDYFFLIQDNLATIQQSLETDNTQAINDCRQEMLFASKQLQLNAAIETLQAVQSNDQSALNHLKTFFNQLQQDLASTTTSTIASPSLTSNNEAIDIECFFDVIWKSLSTLRKIAQISPIDGVLLQSEISQLTQHCRDVKPLDIHQNLEKWSQIFQDNALDAVQISGLVNDLYTYFWDQEDQLNQPGSSGLCRTTTQQAETKTENFDSASVLEEKSVFEEKITFEESLPDAIFVIDFLENLHQQLPDIQRYHLEFQQHQQLPTAWFERIGQLATQSQALGFHNLANLLSDIMQAAQQSQISTESLAAFELQLFAQLCKIGEALPEGRRSELTEITNLTSVFKQWHSEHCFQELALLIDNIAELQNSGSMSTIAIERLHSIQLHLQSLLFSCQYWQLTQCEQAVLLLIDLFHRAEIEPQRLTPVILQEILQLGQHFGRCFDETLTDGETNETEVTQWIHQLTQQSQPAHNAQQMRIARSFCNSLRLPDCLIHALNDDDYEKIGIAIMQQQHLFLLYSDIEDNEAQVNAFFNLLETPQLSVITNATDYVQTRSVFYFLVTSRDNAARLTQTLQQIDPTQTRLTLTPLVLNPVDPNKTINTTQTIASAAAPSFDQSDLQDLDLLQQALGQLVSIKTHMLQSSEAIKNFHLGEDILQYLQPVLPANQALPSELQLYLQNFTEVIDQWMQSQEALNTVADQLQDSLKNLQQAPLQPLFNRIEQWFQQQLTQFDSSSHHQLLLPAADATLEPVLINKTQMPALESALQQLLNTYFSNMQQDASIRIQTHSMERGTQCSLSLAPALSHQHLDIDALQSLLAEHNIRMQSHLEQNQLQQIDLTLEDDHRIIEGLIVAADQVHYVIPTHMVKRLVNRNDVELMSVSAAAGSQMVKVEQQLFPLSFFPQQNLAPTDTDAQSILLVLEAAEKQHALLVDELLGFQQVVVTPLQGQLQSCRGFSGCCVLGKDKVAMVLDATGF
jgi:hypothetical protein